MLLPDPEPPAIPTIKRAISPGFGVHGSLPFARIRHETDQIRGFGRCDLS
jgi:hypothetical protein